MFFKWRKTYRFTILRGHHYILFIMIALIGVLSLSFLINFSSVGSISNFFSLENSFSKGYIFISLVNYTFLFFAVLFFDVVISKVDRKYIAFMLLLGSSYVISVYLLLPFALSLIIEVVFIVFKILKIVFFIALGIIGILFFGGRSGKSSSTKKTFDNRSIPEDKTLDNRSVPSSKTSKEIIMNNYMCRKCGTSIRSESQPRSAGCPKGNMHSWNKL